MNIHKGSCSSAFDTQKAYQIATVDGFALVDTPIQEKLLQQSLDNKESGAQVVFAGLVRNHNNDKSVQKLIYYGYEQLALNQGKILIQKTKERFDIKNAIAVHRIGELYIGDMAIWVGISSAHRYAAFEACLWLLDAIKAEIPIWKQEFYTHHEPLWLSNNG